MKYRKIMMKHILAWTLSVTMMFSTVAVPVLAEGETSVEEDVQETEDPEVKPVVIEEDQDQPASEIEEETPAEEEETKTENPEQNEQKADEPEDVSDDKNTGNEQPTAAAPSQVTEGGDRR